MGIGGYKISYRSVVLLWVFVFFIWGALTLRTYPPINYNLGDEIWAVEGSLNFFDNPPIGYAIPRLYFASLGLFLSLTGGGVFVARLFSLIAGSILLYLTYVLGKEILDEKAGLVSSIVLGSTFAFQWHSNIARPEIMTSLIIVFAFYLLLVGLRENMRLLLYSGILSALSINIHPNNLQYVPGFVAAYVILARKKVFSKATLLFLSGLGAGILAWMVFSYAPSQASSVQAQSAAQAASGILRSYPFPFMNKNLFALFKESVISFPKDYIFQYLRLFNDFFPNNISAYFFAVSAGLVYLTALFTRQRRNVLLLAGFPALTAFFNYFITEQFGYWHVVEFYPFFAVALAAGLKGIEGLRTPREGLRTPREGALPLGRRASTVFVWLFIAVFSAAGIADIAMGRIRMRKYSYTRLLGKVSAAVPSGSKVVARDFYLPALKHADFVGVWFKLERPSANCPGFEDEVKRQGVDYIIMDEGFRTIASKSCGPAYDTEIMRYINLKCSLSSAIDEQYPHYWAAGKIISGVYIFKTDKNM
ncbi:MAG: glycosyltransferase family 39 protein [Thermodesulfovibrionales bacterium]|nr:glycosyltransferase family 39 protein [Thermodesulfovibrionales bacterium]